MSNIALQWVAICLFPMRTKQGFLQIQVIDKIKNESNDGALQRIRGMFRELEASLVTIGRQIHSEDKVLHVIMRRRLCRDGKAPEELPQLNSSRPRH